ncbi:MAG: excinuclease ABC subunit UvrC [Candidatus Omnitrophica bacterium]|nr:excinuclease ABC subunit UvrC [Candidatus Omnitrophota bacterium]
MDIREKVRGLPVSPGVYIMKDSSGSVLYVGKAINLRKRASSYFYPHRALAERTRVMAGKVADIAYIGTSTEAEALIYENSLIKQLAPKYNVALKDDKSYPRLKLTMNEEFPRLLITRKKADDEALYYGPYTSAKLLREALVMLRRMFPLRTCVRMPKSVCLNYHIKQCPGPCAKKVDWKSYMDTVAELKLFLEGDRSALIKHLAGKMMEASKREDYEEAGRLKARIEALSSIKEKAISYLPREEVEELRDMLGIKGSIEIIEAFDVSNIMGEAAVGSMVYFYKGRPRKSEYRRFKIKNVTGVDDYSMMREIVRRRYSRLLNENKRLPDLILIDGGKGHLAAASVELTRLGLSDIPIIGLAKEFEHIYSKERPDPIILPRDSKALHLLERIRNEAHRFAITYHKHVRSRKILPGFRRHR